MKISKKSDYGIILAMTLAQIDGDAYLSLQDIAQSLKLPLPFLKQIAHKLLKSGIIESREGLRGGYRLKMGANSLSVGDIIRSIEGVIEITDCASTNKQKCLHEDTCLSKTIFRRLWKDFVEKLDSTYLSEI